MEIPKRGGEPNHPFTEKRGKTYKNATICDFDIYIVAPFIKHTSIPQTLCPSKKHQAFLPGETMTAPVRLQEKRRRDHENTRIHIAPPSKSPKMKSFFSIHKALNHDCGTSQPDLWPHLSALLWRFRKVKWYEMNGKQWSQKKKLNVPLT